MKENRFLNFPISLIRPALRDINEVCNDIMEYAIYTHAERLMGGECERIEIAADFFGITIEDPELIIENAEFLIQRLPDKSATTSIRPALALEYYNEHKTEYEIVLLLAFLAIKSILGTKPYCKITTDFLLCRMAGFTSFKEIDSMPKELEKYKIRYHIDKLKEDLAEQFGLRVYGRHTRGFYVSFTLPFDELVRVVELKRKMTKRKIKKGRQKLTIHRVISEIKSDF